MLQKVHRQDQADFEPLPFDAAAARSYRQIMAAVVETIRSHPNRIGDLLIAATAHANGFTLYTRNLDALPDSTISSTSSASGNCPVH